MIQHGHHYTFAPIEDCGPGLVSLRGEVVTVVEVCDDGWAMVECGDGEIFRAHPEELHEHLCAKNPPILDPYDGLEVIALEHHHSVMRGAHYIVTGTNANNLILLSHYNPATNELEPVKGWHDPRCFREAA